MPGPTPALVVVKPENGWGVASLVLGVASLVAVISFILFPLAMVASVVGLVLGIVGLIRIGNGRGTNRGQAIAGVVCCSVALLLSIVLAVRVGTWVSQNRSPLRRLEACLTRATDNRQVGRCFSRFSIEISRTGHAAGRP
jgi:hypothetical protein